MTEKEKRQRALSLEAWKNKKMLADRLDQLKSRSPFFWIGPTHPRRQRGSRHE